MSTRVDAGAPAEPTMTPEQTRAYLRAARWKLCSLMMQHDAGAPLGNVSDLPWIASVVISSDVYWLERTPAEDALLKVAMSRVANRQGQDRFRGAGLVIGCLATDVLEAGWPGSIVDAPPELREAWWHFLLRPPMSFDKPGEAELYPRLLERVMDELLLVLNDASRPDRDAAIKAFFASGAFMLSYFTSENLRPLLRKRARVIERIVELQGTSVDEARFPRPDTAGRRIKVGFLVPNLHSATETTFLYAHLKTLDRTVIESVIYMYAPPLTPLAAACMQLVDRVSMVPEDRDTALRLLRRERLDVMVVSTNISAVQHELVRLAVCRLAPVQLITMATPVTTGMRHIDGVLTGTWNEPDEGMEAHYTEIPIPVGPMLNCYPFPTETGGTPRTRAGLGLAEDSVLFFSGANHFKVTPELVDAWAEILASVPGSTMIAMPFNPNWSSDYPRQRFSARVSRQLAARGVDPARFQLVNATPTRADVMHYIGLADIYLDAYPFSGACSALDPLVLGVPLVAWYGETTRSRHAYAMLRSAGLEDMAAADRAGYVAKAAALGRDASLRAQARSRVEAARQAGFAFLDADAYGRQITSTFRDLMQGWRAHEAAQLARGDQSLIAEASAAVRDHVAAGGAALRVTDNDLLSQIVLPYFRDLSGGARPRRFIDVGAAMGGMSLPLLIDGWEGTLFEPDPRCRAQLNAMAGQFPGRARHEALAVGEQSLPQITFQVADTVGLSGFGSSPYAGSTPVSVPCVSLADYMKAQGIDRLDFLKIDAEGYDFAVLRGLDFSQFTPALVMVEFGTQYAGTDGTATNQAIAWMAQRGYRAAAFVCTDDGNFARQDWTYRLIDVTGEHVDCPQGTTTIGNILFYRAGDARFAAGILDLIGQVIARDN